MGQLGHADAGFTLRTYAQQMDRRDGERERLAALVRGEAMPQNGTDPRVAEPLTRSTESPGGVGR